MMTMRLNRWMVSGLAPVVLGGTVTLAALTGCGSSTPTTPGPTTAPTGTGTTTATDDPEANHHRMMHGGGTMGLIGMSLKDLDLTADQKTKVEAIKADLKTKMEPVRAAGKELAGVLADGVAAGAVDRAKADAAIEKLGQAAEAFHAASQDSTQQLHDLLTPAQRTALMDKVIARAGKWHESHGDAHGHQGPPSGPPAGHMGAMKDLGLTDDQKAKIRDNMKAMGGGGGGQGGGGGGGHGPGGGPGSDQHDHKELADHLQAFAVAFKGDTFDAKAQAASGGRAAGHMARFGATHMARFLEAAAPVLTPEQRTKLSASIRDHANKPQG
jgi:Spy/CpxP family protein refolding chaperone